MIAKKAPVIPASTSPVPPTVMPAFSNGFYARVCGIQGVKPQEAVHIGDHWVFDFINPCRIGMNAYYLDRKRKRGGSVIARKYVISDLSELLGVFGR
ncbi:MAG: hypothetical protein N2V78_12590 [Methanophagales archaeon]|nr:hypothetical protein [Methanophagales archaeon]